MHREKQGHKQKKYEERSQERGEMGEKANWTVFRPIVRTGASLSTASVRSLLLTATAVSFISCDIRFSPSPYLYLIPLFFYSKLSFSGVLHNIGYGSRLS